jgi:iron complex outermembrane recepter protein
MKTQSIFSRSRLSASVAPVVLGLAMISMPAFAQTAPAADDAAADAEPIIVTGSRIARPDLTSNSPISVVTGEILQDKGVVNIEDALNDLPQIVPGLNSNVNNGGNGTVTVDIRGLGPSRTLVLVNGRRLVPSNNTGVVDLNLINPQLIDRVDVVTGGASATYGSDALGGVVNFILKKNFEGFEATGQYSITDRGDSSSYTIGGLLGGNFADDRGNASIAVSYTDRKPSFQSQRSFLRVDQNGGSATGVAGRLDNLFSNPFSPGGNRAFNADGSVRPFVNDFDLTNPATDRFNFAPTNYVQTPQKRFTLTALGNYEITDRINAFFEGTYVQSNVTLQLAPTPATNIFVDPLSPVLSASARALAATRPNPLAPLTFRRRTVEAGPRVQTFRFDVTQFNVGFNGKAFGDFNYEVYYGRGRVDNSAGLQNDVSRSRLTSGLNGCPAGSPAGCVSVNAFGPNTLTPAAINFVRISSAVDEFSFNRDNVVGSLAGTVPGLSAGRIGIAFGAEYRRDATTFIPSDAAQRGDLTGFNAVLPTSGSFNSKEVFGELSIPLLADKPFFNRLTIALKGRYSDYSTVGGITTYSGEGEWVPVEGLRLRSTYSRATRAPSVFELFQARDQAFPAVVDPCFRGQPSGTRPVPSAGVQAICVLQGLPSPATNILVQTNSQIEASQTGNRNLKEEKSDTFTAGVQINPSFAKKLTLSVDYFDIKIDGYVSRLQGGATGLVTKCFGQSITTAAQLAADPFCSLLSRRPSGELLVTTPQSNLADVGVNNKLKTRGIDFSVENSYGLGFLGLGKSRISTSTTLTYLLDYKFNGQQFARFASADFGTLPRIRSNSRVTYSDSALSVGVNWRYIGKSTDTAGDITDPTGFTKLKAVSYFDLNTRVSVGDRFEIFGGVDNLLDKAPPAVFSGFTATNTDETLYDVLGRRFFVGVKVKL